MPVRFAPIVATLLLFGSAPALAQWNPGFTASLGRGYGNIALSQSILNNTRALGKSPTTSADADGGGSAANAAAPTGGTTSAGRTASAGGSASASGTAS